MSVILAEAPPDFPARSKGLPNTEAGVPSCFFLIKMKIAPNQSQILMSLREAITLHNAGRLDAADAIYRQVLQHVPRHPDALHLRALILHAKERFSESARLAESAISVAPGIANFYNTAGEAYRRMGELDKARERFLEAIRLDPTIAIAQHNLSLVLCAEGRHWEASSANRRALALDAEYLDAIVQGIEIAIALDDQHHAVALVGRLAGFSGNPRAATGIARFCADRARRLLQAGHVVDAQVAAGEAIAASPQDWTGWALRAEAHLHLMELAEAELLATIAANLAPENDKSRHNLTFLLQYGKRIGEAYSHFEGALAKRPDDANARYGLAGVDLIQCNYAAGWPNFEARWQLPGHGSKPDQAPQWQGQAVSRLLLYAEQGLGDSLQMLRFVPEVVRRCGGEVVVQVQQPLVRLARRVFASVGVEVCADASAGRFDAACALMSLPSVLGVHSPQRLLGEAVYLHASPGRTGEFADIFAKAPGRKLGIVWQGAAGSSANRLRKLPESVLLPLLDLPGWTAVSLQFGLKSPCIASHPLLDISDQISDFEDLAAAMRAVDVVVSLDTGPAHLAGALGVPVFILLPWLHDWRWGLAGPRCDWYASMTVFRQHRNGDWSEAVSRLAAQLGGVSRPCTDAAAGPLANASIVGNRFPFVRAACRHGVFTLPLFDRFITRSMLVYGEYSPREAEVICSFLRPGDTVLDVGANLGTLTLAMAHAVGPSGRVIAFEPQEMIHRCLTETLAETGVSCVEARRQAVGAASGVAFIERKDPANPENFGGVGLTGAGVGEPVELVSLDDLGLRQCRLIKVDIEGLELEALHGGTRLIEVHRPVLYVECDRPGMQEPLTAFLEKIGYRVFLHRPPLFSPNNFRRCETNLFPGLVSGNLLALPAGESPPSDAVLIDGATPQAQR